MLLLDCQDADTASASLAAILGLPRTTLEQWLLTSTPDPYPDVSEFDYNEPEDILASEIQQSLGVTPSSDWITACIFHCTRTLDASRFEEGIEPLGVALADHIWADLYRWYLGRYQR